MYADSHSNNILNASISWNKERCILLSPEWAYHILYNWNNKKCKNALRVTFGHEIAHSNDLVFECTNDVQKRFLSYLNEVLADFNAYPQIQKILIDSFEYKIACYKIAEEERVERQQRRIIKWERKPYECKPTDSHPSLKQRLGYVQTGVLDKKLINQIASDAKCYDSLFINQISNNWINIPLN